MTTSTNNSPSFVTTPAGARIPKIGSLAYHPSIGFCSVAGRVGDRVRLLVTDFSEALPVTLSAPVVKEDSNLPAITAEQAELAEEFGITSMMSRKPRTTETIDRSEWMRRVADASEDAALAEMSLLDARLADETDGLYGASALVKQLQESAISRTRGANEMIVALDGAEDVGWEFDEYLVYTPSRKRTRGQAPAPRPQPAPASKVGTTEDPDRPDWIVAEMNECFGDAWTPLAQTR